MDTVGTFEMAVALSAEKYDISLAPALISPPHRSDLIRFRVHFRLVTAVHKHYSVEQWKKFVSEHKGILPYLAVSSGTRSASLSLLVRVLLRGLVV
jgi:hypothetical protein